MRNLKEKNRLEFEGGITLVALIITIIVLIILAAVSINTVFKANFIGIATNGTINYAEAQIEEENSISDVDKLVQDTIEKIKDKNSNTGGVAKTPVEKELSYVGYYADIEGDGKVDGIIYVDLTKGKINPTASYTIPVIENTKDYYVSKTGYNGPFGTKDVLTPMGTGNERFYIMALEDVKDEEHGNLFDWYNAASEGTHIMITSEDFGTGQSNTTTMMARWNAKEYGEQDKCTEHKDMWGAIQEEVNNGWFVPSQHEWLAYGDVVSFGSLGSSLGDPDIWDGHYWTSSCPLNKVVDIFTFSPTLDEFGPGSACKVRLSRKF